MKNPLYASDTQWKRSQIQSTNVLQSCKELSKRDMLINVEKNILPKSGAVIIYSRIDIIRMICNNDDNNQNDTQDCPVHELTRLMA